MSMKHAPPDVLPYASDNTTDVLVQVKPRLRKRISAFADYTSMHGPAHVKRVRTALHKTFWIAFLLTALVGLLYQITSLVTHYQSKPYAVLLDTKFDRTIKFPAVTICNSNPYR